MSQTIVINEHVHTKHFAEVFISETKTQQAQCDTDRAVQQQSF